jgi:predicted alpha/beta superfamily hydrolase
VLVGIENTQRRRDLTGPTQNEEDKKIAPHVGGSAAFRKFLRDELMPDVKARYRTTDETAIVGESLAGLFVIETFLLEPDLFDTYIAIDPSLWWNDSALVKSASERLRTQPKANKWLWFSSAATEQNAFTQRCRQRTNRRDCYGASRRWPRRSIRRSIIPPRSGRSAPCSRRERRSCTRLRADVPRVRAR